MKILQIILSALILFTASCKKSISIDPPINQLSSDLVFKDDASATAALNGIFANMTIYPEDIFNGGTALYAGLCADELWYYSPSDKQEFFKNDIGPSSHITIQSNIWTPAYSYIYGANACIEGINASTGLTPAGRSQLMGEAKFIRALSFFYLTNLFGDVPLQRSTDYEINRLMARTPKAEVYQQIEADLKEAEALLPSDYATTERTRPIKWAATAMLARLYLYQERWNEAEAKATEVINAPHYILHSNLNDVFLGTSKEAIWQLKPANPSRNTHEARSFIPASASTAPTYLMTSSLIDSFDASDKRFQEWTKQHTFGGQTYRYPYKYKVRGGPGIPITEYCMILRLAEMYLIRAEARIQQNKLTTGQDDLNIIRDRADLAPLNLSEKGDLLMAVDAERRKELFAELGHRWFDLIRTNRANDVLSLKGPEWAPTDQLWPLPQEEINMNPSLIQNPGY